MLFCCVTFLFFPFLDDVLNSDLWVEAICDSVYFENVLNVKVPTMTSDTKPEGEVFASSNYTNFNPYLVFDGSYSAWHSAAGEPQFIGYMFPNKVCVKKVYIMNGNQSGSKSTYIQASNDGNEWVNLTSAFDCGGSEEITALNIKNNNYYKYYRIYAEKLTYTNMNKYYWLISVLQFYGRIQ